jgi:hypothetical protein
MWTRRCGADDQVTDNSHLQRGQGRGLRRPDDVDSRRKPAELDGGHRPPHPLAHRTRWLTATEALAAVGAELTLKQATEPGHPAVVSALQAVSAAAGLPGLDELTGPQRQMVTELADVHSFLDVGSGIGLLAVAPSAAAPMEYIIGQRPGRL